jgi:hypothetical protein
MLFLLKEAVVMNEQAGLRPGRSKVRLERDLVRDKYGNKLHVCIKMYVTLKHTKLLSWCDLPLSLQIETEWDTTNFWTWGWYYNTKQSEF